MTDGSAGGWAPHPDARAPGHPGRTEIGDDGEMLGADSAMVVGLGAICGLSEADPADAVGTTVLNVVLPDDDEPTEAHPFDWLAWLARRRGLTVDPADLRHVPYEVILSAGLSRHLAVD